MLATLQAAVDLLHQRLDIEPTRIGLWSMGGIGGVTMSGLFAAATLVGRDLVQLTLGPANQTASVLAT